MAVPEVILTNRSKTSAWFFGLLEWIGLVGRSKKITTYEKTLFTLIVQPGITHCLFLQQFPPCRIYAQ
jgi:hypothetical protein